MRAKCNFLGHTQKTICGRKSTMHMTQTKWIPIVEAASCCAQVFPLLEQQTQRNGLYQITLATLSPDWNATELKFGVHRLFPSKMHELEQR